MKMSQKINKDCYNKFKGENTKRLIESVDLQNILYTTSNAL